MAKARLPSDWHYTGETFHSNLEVEGVLRHFYWDGVEQAIYQVNNLVRRRGIASFGPFIEAFVVFIDPENPEKLRAVPDADGVGMNYRIEDIFYDREVEQDSVPF